MDKKAALLLGLCMKARKLAVGEYACEQALRSGEAKLMLIAGDASDNTKKKFTNKAFYYEVPVVLCDGRDELSRAIGRENRVVIAVTDDGFAGKLRELLTKTEVGGCLK